MTTANTLYLAALAAENQSPAIVDKVSDDEMYVGYCAPDCTSVNDAKWRIKHIVTTDNIQTIYKSNGSDKMNVKWSDRTTITYKPTENWATN